MISQQNISALVEQYLQESQSGSFLIGVEVTADAHITVTIDNDEAVDIDECVAISRYIEAHTNRDEEDYELEVGSAGLTAPLVTLRQYEKYEGDPVVVDTQAGQKLHGVLGAADTDGFYLTWTAREKVEGSKRKQDVTHTAHFAFNEVNAVRYDLTTF